MHVDGASSKACRVVWGVDEILSGGGGVARRLHKLTKPSWSGGVKQAMLQASGVVGRQWRR